MSSTRRAICALATVAIVDSACTAGIREDGPLVVDGGDPVGSGELCIPAEDEARHGTLGGTIIKNEGEVSLTISHVSLMDSKSMRIIESVLVPVPKPDPETGQINLVPASGYGYPALSSDSDSPASYREHEEQLWSARRPAIRSVLAPGEHWSMAVGLDADNVPASMKSLMIEYEIATGELYRANSSVSVSNRIQPVEATPACWSNSRCSLNASAGVFQPSVLRGLVLSA